MSDLAHVPTDRLREELARRDRETIDKRTAERKAREIAVVCPTCNGSGQETYFNMRVAAGEDDGKRTCVTCGGKGRIVAYRVV